MDCQLPKCLIWNSPADSFVAEASLPATDRGFRYGMSVFETVLVASGQPVFVTEHLGNLRAAAELAGLQCPDGAIHAIPDALAALPDDFTGVVRVYLTAGDGNPADPPTTGRVLILIQPRAFADPATTADGLSMISSATLYSPVFGGLKTGNYWENIRQLQSATAVHADEAVLFNPSGKIVSGCMSNLFMVLDNCLVTPSLSTGARHGVLRQWVVSQVPVEEALLTAQDLSRADEVFLTSSWLGIATVGKVDARSIPARDVADKLAATYRTLLPSA